MSRLAKKLTPNSPLNLVLRQLLSLCAMLWLCTNLLLALSILLLLTIFKTLLPFEPVQKHCDKLSKWLYRWAVAVDSFFIKHIIGTQIEIRGEVQQHPAPIVMSNHVCAFDIPLLQELISGRGPMLKFLIKKEIIWIPIFGWVCLLLDFPRLNRSQFKNEQSEDYQTVRDASKQHGVERREHSGALLIFPEGTRYTEKKRIRKKSPYQQLLPPKSGGLKIIQKHAPKDTPLIDITIDYGHAGTKGISLWKCLHGQPNKIVIHVEHYNLSEIDDIQSWLNERWVEKDKCLMQRA